MELTSNLENQAFVHYIFMENVFSLPTASGFPLKFSLAGVVSPGARGGLTFSFASVSHGCTSPASLSLSQELTATLLLLALTD